MKTKITEHSLNKLSINNKVILFPLSGKSSENFVTGEKYGEYSVVEIKEKEIILGIEVKFLNIKTTDLVAINKKDLTNGSWWLDCPKAL